MPKSFYLLTFVSLLCLSLFACGPTHLNNPQMVQHTGKSTVALVYQDVDNDDDDISNVKPFCSGVWVDDAHILTAYHCAKGLQKVLQAQEDAKEAKPKQCSVIEVITDQCDPDSKPAHKVIEIDGLSVHFIQQNEVDTMGKEPTAWHLSKVVSWDADHDLALLLAIGRAIPAHDVAELADKVPAIGEEVVAVGHPKGFYWTYLHGTVAAYQEEVPGSNGRGPLLQIQSPIYYGNSGGGVFNIYGQLVGIADLLPDLPSEGLCIPVESIHSFLKAHRSLEVLKQPGVSPPL